MVRQWRAQLFRRCAGLVDLGQWQYEPVFAASWQRFQCLSESILTMSYTVLQSSLRNIEKKCMVGITVSLVGIDNQRNVCVPLFLPCPVGITFACCRAPKSWPSPAGQVVPKEAWQQSMSWPEFRGPEQWQGPRTLFVMVQSSKEV